MILPKAVQGPSLETHFCFQSATQTHSFDTVLSAATRLPGFLHGALRGFMTSLLAAVPLFANDWAAFPVSGTDNGTDHTDLLGEASLDVGSHPDEATEPSFQADLR